MRRQLCAALAALTLIGLLAGCGGRGQRPEDLPTPVDLDAMATALPLTQNAPPTPYNNDVTAFEQIDNRLNELPGWRYVVEMEFTGVFARTPRQTQATARAEVWFNQFASARRVLLNTSGELIGREEDTGYEAVRLGPDAFLVQGNTCLSNAGTDAEIAADLRAGDLVGGVRRAVPAGRRATLNGEDVWLYSFAPEDLVLPSVRLADGGTMTVASSELWIAPARNAVVRFWANIDLENAVLLDRQLPVTGRLILRYDLYDVGTAVNITVPFGC